MNDWILTDPRVFEAYGKRERTCRFCTLITSVQETRPDYMHAPGCRLRFLTASAPASTPGGTAGEGSEPRDLLAEAWAIAIDAQVEFAHLGTAATFVASQIALRIDALLKPAAPPAATPATPEET